MKKPILICSICKQAECYTGEFKCKDYDMAEVSVKLVEEVVVSTNRSRYSRKAIGIPHRRGKLWQG